jgi:hypothetical protein
MGLPIHITKIKIVNDLYEVSYNNMWLFINTFNQIEDMAWNFDDVKDILMQYERKKKIFKIMNLDNIIYNNKIIYQKNDY